jgi:LPS-assembly lipoprotein
MGYVAYDRSAQRFATIRAARDSDIRLAKTLSEQIRIRLATALATRA